MTCCCKLFFRKDWTPHCRQVIALPYAQKNLVPDLLRWAWVPLTTVSAYHYICYMLMENVPLSPHRFVRPPDLQLEDTQGAFEELKRCFTMAPILQHPDLNVPFIVEVNALNCGMGGVCSCPIMATQASFFPVHSSHRSWPLTRATMTRAVSPRWHQAVHWSLLCLRPSKDAMPTPLRPAGTAPHTLAALLPHRHRLYHWSPKLRSTDTPQYWLQ